MHNINFLCKSLEVEKLNDDITFLEEMNKIELNSDSDFDPQVL